MVLGVIMALWLCKEMAVFLEMRTDIKKGKMTSCLSYKTK